MADKKVTLAHGAGGKQTSELIHEVFQAHFSNPEFTADDAAVLNVGNGKIAMSTDGFIVSPYEFNGGNIGKLSICGTVNDLSCMGAKPLYLTCSFIIEEGFSMEKLEEIAASMEKYASSFSRVVRRLRISRCSESACVFSLISRTRLATTVLWCLQALGQRFTMCA